MDCPSCDAEMLPLLWGYPSATAMSAAFDEGLIAIGGCVLPDVDEVPNYRCPECRTEAIGPDWEMEGVFPLGWVSF